MSKTTKQAATEALQADVSTSAESTPQADTVRAAKAPSKPAKGRAAKSKAKPKGEATPRKRPHGTGQATVIELMSRPQGATTQEMVDATGWMKHTIRGVISAVLRKKMGLKVETQRKDDVTTYRIIGGRAAT